MKKKFLITIIAVMVVVLVYSCTENSIDYGDLSNNIDEHSISNTISESFVKSSGRYHNELIERWFDKYGDTEPHNIYKDNVLENLLNDLSRFSIETPYEMNKSNDDEVSELFDMIIEIFDLNNDSITLDFFMHYINETNLSEDIKYELNEVKLRVNDSTDSFLLFINQEFGESLTDEYDILMKEMFISISNSSYELWFDYGKNAACDQNNVIAFDAAGALLGTAICGGVPFCGILGGAASSMLYRAYHGCNKPDEKNN